MPASAMVLTGHGTNGSPNLTHSLPAPATPPMTAAMKQPMGAIWKPPFTRPSCRMVASQLPTVMTGRRSGEKLGERRWEKRTCGDSPDQGADRVVAHQAMAELWFLYQQNAVKATLTMLTCEEHGERGADPEEDLGPAG